MLYCNQELRAEERTFEFGSIYQVSMGEYGRGRKLIALTCPNGTIVKNGMNNNITIGLTKSGKPRIIDREDDKNLFLLLSSKGQYTRRGNGTIMVPKKQIQNYAILARGNGADGDAGRIGHWACILLMINNLSEKNIVRIQKGGAGYGIPPYFLLIEKRVVFQCPENNLEEACEILGFELPNMEATSWINL